MATSSLALAGGLVGVTLIVAGIVQSRLDQSSPIALPQQQIAAPQAVQPVTAPSEKPQAAPSAPQRIAAPPVREVQNQEPQRRFGSVELKADETGHFHAKVDINGRSFDMLVDTGATTIALTHDDARKAAINVAPSDFRYPINTAAGVLKAARVRLTRVAIGPIMVRDLEAQILPPGTGKTSLLGMNFLRGLSSYEVKDNKMIMRN